MQQPSAASGVSGGQPEFIPLLARAAVAAGIDGLFLEVHDDPANAKSDGANALDLKLLKPLLETLLAIQAAAGAYGVAAHNYSFAGSAITIVSAIRSCRQR